MYITWYGQSCFKVQVRPPGSKGVILAIDPASVSQAGLKKPFFKADIVISSEARKDLSIRPTEKEFFFISGPGEYEIKGVFVSGIPFKDTVIYRIETEKMVLAHLNQIGQILGDEQLEALNGVDVLTIPIGNKPVLSTDQAINLINRIEPRLIIPCCYKIPGLKLKLEPLAKFLKEMGAGEQEGVDQLKIIKKDLPTEGREIKVLKNV